MHLRHRIGRIGAWMAVTTVSAAAAWAALQPILDTAVPDRLDVPSPDELRADAGGDGDAAGTTATLTPTASPSTPPSASPPVSSPPPTSPPTSPSTSSPPSSPPPESPPPETDPPDPPPTTVDPGEQPVEVDDWTPVELDDGTTAYVQSIAVEGGTAVVQVSSGRATLVSATPNEPYSVETEQSPDQPERMIVDFSTAGHLYVIDAMWWEGGPYAQVAEVG